MVGMVGQSIGAEGCVRDSLSPGVIGLFLGSLNVYDPYLWGQKDIRVYRAVLLEKSVYIIAANCVKYRLGAIRRLESSG